MEFETIHQMYRHWFETRSSLAACHLKRGGRWEPVTWHAFGEEMDAFAMGLMALGMQHGDAVTILGRIRKEWDIADKAILSAGGVSVGCCPSSTPAVIRHVIRHSESRFLIVEDAEQWEKVAQIRGELPLVHRIIIMDPEGTGGQGLPAFQEVVELGRRQDTSVAESYRRRASSVTSEDTAILSYTSGEAETPKGAMLSHRNILEACGALRDLEIFSAQDVTVIGLPLPDVFGRVAQAAGTYIGTRGYYAENPDRVEETLREIRPTVFFGVPGILEKLYSRVVGEAAEVSGIRKKVFQRALDVGLTRSRLLQEGRDLPASLGLQYRFADALVCRRIREAFGGRIRIVLTGGGRTPRHILEFFHAAGILPLEMYGLPEAPVCAANLTNRYRFGTVGLEAPGVALRVAGDGEILVKSGMVFKGYLRDEEATRAVFTEEGWLATGDVGGIDPDGFVRIAGRKKAS